MDASKLTFEAKAFDIIIDKGTIQNQNQSCNESS